MNDKTKIINMDTYSLQDEWLEKVAENHFNVEEQNMLRVGLLGYINEVMSNITEDSGHMTNIYYNEIIPIRANLPETIYSNASLVNYEDFNATPAETFITLAIKKEHLIEKSIVKPSHREFYISKNSYFKIDGKYKFMLDHPIIITIKDYFNDNGTKDWIFTPRYDLTKSNTKNIMSAPYINSFINKMYDDEFLFLNVKVSQIEYRRQIINVYSSNIIDNLTFRVNYSGQLSHFKIYYKESEDSKMETITPYFMDNLNPSDEYFCFYKYLNSNTYEIFFSPFGSYFRPDIGSQLIVDTYTTLGTEANFTYTGDNVIFYFEPDPDTNESYSINYTGTTSFAITNTASVGGENIKSLDEVKKRVVEEFSLRNSIITENDLNIFFNRFNENSSIYFVKKRDDIIQRLFSAFILFKDENGNILPTNTVTTHVDQDDIDVYSDSQKVFMVKAGRQFESVDGSNIRYNIVTDKLSSDEVMTNEAIKEKFYLSNPFLTRYSFNPVKTSYYFNSVDDVYPIKYTYMNKNSFHEFAINDVVIKRNALMDDIYNIEFELTTNISVDKILEKDPDTGVRKDTGEIKMKGIFKVGTKTLGYIDFKPIGVFPEKGKVKYKAILRTTDFIDLEEMIEIENSIKIEEGGLGRIVPSMFLPCENLTLEICCFHRTIIEQNGVQRLQTLEELSGYSLVNLYETEQHIKLFTNLDSVINSKLVISDNGKGDYIFRTTSVPMVKYNYVISNKPENIFKSFKSYINLINENMYRLENNFDIDIKFYNTYGKSIWFTLSDGKNKIPLDRTNITLNLRIKTNIPIEGADITNIKNFITDYIERVNIGNNSSIYISNIIRELEDNFDFIVFVQFNGINDHGPSYQVIQNELPDIYKMDRLVLQDYVPEFINVNKDTLISRNALGLTPQINIEFI